VAIQQATTCHVPERGRDELVHFTGGECFACGGEGRWRTANTRLVRCPKCKQTRTYRDTVARFRDPLEILEDKDEAYERLKYWVSKLKTGKVGKTGLWQRYGITTPRRVHTATGSGWGLFLAPFDEAGIEYVSSTGTA
jgi:hypothetical protein